MHILYLTLSCIFLVAGFIGIFIPGLPGIPFAFLGYVFIGLATHFHNIPISVYIILGILTFLSLIGDYFGSVLTVKWGGGSKWGIFGAVLGTFLGILSGNIILLFISPLFFAFLFEFFASGNAGKSVKVGFFATGGFFASILFKLVIYFLMPVIFFLFHRRGSAL